MKEAIERTLARMEVFAAEQTDQTVYVACVQVIGMLKVLLEEMEPSQ